MSFFNKIISSVSNIVQIGFNAVRNLVGLGPQQVIFVQPELIIEDNNDNEMDVINNNIENGVFGTFKITRTSIEDVIYKIELNPNVNVLLRVNNVFRPIRLDNLSYMKELINRDVINEINVYGSDAEYQVELNNVNSIEIIISKKTSQPEYDGGFFKFLNTTNKDLDKYGIFKSFDKNNYVNNCLFEAFKVGGMDDEKLKIFLNIASINSKNGVIPVSKLKIIASTLKIRIILKKQHHTNEDKFLTTYYGDSNNETETFKIGLIEGHYFNNTFDDSLNDEPYNIIRDLSRCKPLEDSNLYKIGKCVDIDNHILNNLDMKRSEIIELKTYEHNIPDEDVYFFDTETITSNEHEAILLCVSSYDNSYKETFFGDVCGKNFLWSLHHRYANPETTEKFKIILIAHNLLYDFSAVFRYLNIIRFLKTNGRLMSAECMFGCLKITLKDSLTVIPTALRNFPNYFNLDCHKEVMPYKLYTRENVNKRIVPIDEAVQILIQDNKTEDDIQHFLENIKLFMTDSKHFNCMKYNEYYCKLDVEVLKQGYKTFRKWILESMDIDILEKLSLPQIAFTYQYNEGCFEGVYKVSGLVREFIQKCSSGGRVMTRDNEKHHVTDELNDFDAVSLYLTAMILIPGFPKGQPKLITNPSTFDLKNVDEYFLQIKIKKVKKTFHFPLITDDERGFINDPDPEKIYYVDRMKLEDLITFHQIDYEIIQGLYFNDGYNDNINRVSKFLFEERIKKKKDKNPIQIIYKLIGNSSYGKLNQAPIEHTEQILTDNRRYMKTKGATKYDAGCTYMEHVLSTKFNSLTSLERIKTDPYNGNTYIAKFKKSFYEHYNYVHCGSMVLSKAKRIMNEVMCLAEDHDLKIYYTDTDSMLIRDTDIQTLEKEFKLKYKRDLIGNNYGQFHIDFPMGEGDISKPVAVSSYFIGKKSYYCKIKNTDKDGNIYYTDHIRAKGITTSTIQHYNKHKEYYNELNGEDLNINNPEDIYKLLYEGKTLSFDLAKDNPKFINENFKFRVVFG